MSHQETMDNLYKDLWSAHGEGPFSLLDNTLDPRPSTMMMDLAQEAGLKAGQLVLDVGSGRGNRAYELSERFGCRTLGLEPAWSNLARARQDGRSRNDPRRVTFLQGLVDRLPYADGSADLVWCRDMLVHVLGLEGALAEIARVSKLGGPVVLMTTLATDLMSKREAERLFSDIEIVVPNLWPDRFERALNGAGLEVVRQEVVYGERVEYAEENEGQLSRQLLRLARMIRAEEHLSDALGPERFRLARALYYWGIYLMIGKLTDVYYILRKT